MTGLRIVLGLLVVGTAAAGLWWLYAILTDRQIRTLIARAEVLERELPRYEWARRFEMLCVAGEHWSLERVPTGAWRLKRYRPSPSLSVAGADAREAVDRACHLAERFTA